MRTNEKNETAKLSVLLFVLSGTLTVVSNFPLKCPFFSFIIPVTGLHVKILDDNLLQLMPPFSYPGIRTKRFVRPLEVFTYIRVHSWL